MNFYIFTDVTLKIAMLVIHLEEHVTVSIYFNFIYLLNINYLFNL